MTITFADGKIFDVINIAGRNNMTHSISDVIANSDREIMEIIIRGDCYIEEQIKHYYNNPDNCSTITITDDEGNKFDHLDYVIPIRFITEYNGDGCKFILIMAQLTEVDKALREIAGKVTYIGSELEVAKAKKIDKSKKMLAEWLEANPMKYTDGRFYSVTEQKQSLLNGNLTSFERAQDAGIPYQLKWNSTGAECEEWDYPDLVALSLTIASYVAPKVAAQQALEIAINDCDSIEAVEAVEINYDNT